MIGRDIATSISRPSPSAPRRRRRCSRSSGLGWEDRLDDISLSVGAGEIVGLGGLDGQGQRKLLLALFGVLRGVTGAITVDGRPVRPGSPGRRPRRRRSASRWCPRTARPKA